MKWIATWIRECDEAAFAERFSVYPDVGLKNARTESFAWDTISALLLTGGSDISLAYLRQPVPDPTLIEDPNPERDAWDFPALERALVQKMPIFAICRGMQVLNVALGGTLHLHIPGHDRDKFNNVQKLHYLSDQFVQIPEVNSSHHQALDGLGKGIVIQARHAGDAIIEQIQLEPYPFALGVQYHPERHPLYRPLFDAFVEHVRKEKFSGP